MLFLCTHFGVESARALGRFGRAQRYDMTETSIWHDFFEQVMINSYVMIIMVGWLGGRRPLKYRLSSMKFVAARLVFNLLIYCGVAADVNHVNQVIGSLAFLYFTHLQAQAQKCGDKRWSQEASC